MSKFWRALTVLVAVGAVLALAAAALLPSLLRARVQSSGTPPSYAMPAPAAAPPTTAGFSRAYEADRPMNTEAYHRIVDNAFLAVADTPLSTFSIDVDTASYANVRRF